jgi:hypothetical protein
MVAPNPTAKVAVTTRKIMHAQLFPPDLANIYYIGGGSLGLVLLIVVVVLLIR